MHEAVFEYFFGDYALAICQAHHCHNLGLHISGKTRIGIGLDIYIMDCFTSRTGNVVIADFEAHASLFQLMNNCFHMFRNTWPDSYASPGDACGSEICCNLNTIGHDGMVQRL